MKYQIDHDFHIHSHLSFCSNDENQTTDEFLRYAEKNGFKKIFVTDHLWDSAVSGASEWYKPQNIKHISQNLPLPTSDTVIFGFGCETELDKDMRLALQKENYDKFDFIIIPTTHMHMSGLTIPKGTDDSERAKLYVQRLMAVLDMELPFGRVGIAHLACPLMSRQRAPQSVLANVEETELMPLFEKAARLGVGIEINAADFNFSNCSDERRSAVLHLFGMAKEAGCKFYLGSDAHHPNRFKCVVPIFEMAVTDLGLTEEDKFIVREM